MEKIDLRSDTVTKPTDEMREAMKEAEVGDDVLGEDPTVKKLEDLAAKKLGKESGLFVTSGTQGNITSLLTHTEPGEEVVMGKCCHIHRYEIGGYASLAGVTAQLLDDKEGHLPLEKIPEVIRADDIHHPKTSLICVENTHNIAGGIPLGEDYMKQVGEIAEENDLPVHLDGARIFNASVALDVDVKDLVKPVDSVQFCLSKGLSAPVGSLLVGSEEFIEKARKNRKKLGGGMRQAGVIAAPGIIALEKMIERLEQDHKNLDKLVDGLEKLNVEVYPEKPRTNIIMVDTTSLEMRAEKLRKKLENEGILSLDLDKNMLRLVTHREISSEDIDKVLEVFENKF